MWEGVVVLRSIFIFKYLVREKVFKCNEGSQTKILGIDVDALIFLWRPIAAFSEL